MFGNTLQAGSLSLAFVAPAAEFVGKALLVLAAIFVVIAIERGNLTGAPAVIIVVAAIAALAAVTLVVALVGLHSLNRFS